MTKFGKFCLYTPLKVAAISVFLSYLLAMIFLTITRGQNSDTEFRHGCDMSGMLYGILIMLSLFASLSSYTIAFNFYKNIRDRFTLSFLTFYLPVVLITVCMILLDESNLLKIIVICLPFLIPQTYYFIRFRKRLKSGEILDDFYE